jgi:hypothetical protein
MKNNETTNNVLVDVKQTDFFIFCANDINLIVATIKIEKNFTFTSSESEFINEFKFAEMLILTFANNDIDIHKYTIENFYNIKKEFFTITILDFDN